MTTSKVKDKSPKENSNNLPAIITAVLLGVAAIVTAFAKFHGDNPTQKPSVSEPGKGDTPSGKAVEQRTEGDKSPAVINSGQVHGNLNINSEETK